MSFEDNHPASEDTAQPVYPVVFFKDDQGPSDMTDWRAQIVPADAPEPVAVEDETPPKDVSVPEPVVSEESTPTVEAKEPESPAPPPADKDTGQLKAGDPGTLASSDPTTAGKVAQPVKPKTPTLSGSSRSAVKPSS